MDAQEEILKALTELKIDMSYVKKHIETTIDQPIRIALVENKVNGLNRIAWWIGTTCGTALIMAVLALII